MTDPKKTFDPFEKEKRLRAESRSWDTSAIGDAKDGDIPVIDLQQYLAGGDPMSLEKAAGQLRVACEEVGFFTVVGHQVPEAQIAAAFSATREFHALPTDGKTALLMDRPDWPVGGTGYLPFRNRKLPARERGNLNEAFVIKRDHVTALDQNQWPESATLPTFRKAISDYAAAMESLGKSLVPLFAMALDMPRNFFDEAFISPTFRLRLTHYPPVANTPGDEFGIAPHVDTTFCTILAQDQPGLTIFSERRKTWINAPMRENAFIVNSGELLKQWTNDRFISVKHFANNNLSGRSRYSMPFFLNANANYKMHCVPSCCGPNKPAKYAPVSYAESQAIAQGE